MSQENQAHAEDEELAVKDPPSAASSASNLSVPEQYQVLEQLGSGANGVVYSAINRYTKRQVAIKMLKDASSTTLDLGRFKREAKTLETFSHPNVIATLDFGVCNRV